MDRCRLEEFKVLNTSRIQSKEVIDYGIQMVGAPLEWDETMGEGIKVGIIDTGIDLNHPDIKGRIREHVSFVKDVKSAQDDNGHGTHVAGIIAAEKNGFGVVGVAPKADLYIAKAFKKDGNGDFKAIKDSLQWMINKNVHVINMSFSAPNADYEYQKIITEVYNKGIVLVAAAGNEGDGSGRDTIGYPAKFNEVIAVTAVDVNKKRASFSSEGEQAEISAAGTDIYSTYLNGGYATLSGTSMATPIISGATAILQAKAQRRYQRRLTVEEMRLVMAMYTEDLGDNGRDRDFGYGLFSFGRIGKSDTVNTSVSSRPFLSFFRR